MSESPSPSSREKRDPKAIEQRVARSLWATMGKARDDNTYLAQVALTTMAHNPKDALAYLNEYLPNGQAAAIVPALPSNEVTLSLTREEAEAVLAASIVGSPVHKTWHIKPFLDAKAKLDAALSSTREPEG